MTTRTWNGTNGNFTDAGNWSPSGVPTSGDTAVINAGTVAATGTISGVTIDLNVAAGASASTTLALNSAALDSASALVVNNAQGFTTAPPAVISVSGTSSFGGTEAFYGSLIQFSIASGSTLVNAGTMDFFRSSPNLSGGGTFQNNGNVALVNPSNGVQVADFVTPITGTGTFALGEHARLEFDGPVGSGQTILMNDGSNGNELLQFNDVGAVNATINGFSASDNLIVNTNQNYTGFNYVSTGSNTGTLQLLSGATPFASLQLQGAYSQSSFSISDESVGNGTSDLFITTSVNNNVSAGLPPGYQGGGSGTALPVYRWFDTKFGTHFFTANVGEALQVDANRSDLTPEVNDFGAVNPATDPAAEAVYRFFDTVHGTHFFTASTSERDSAPEPRGPTSPTSRQPPSTRTRRSSPGISRSTASSTRRYRNPFLHGRRRRGRQRCGLAGAGNQPALLHGRGCRLLRSGRQLQHSEPDGLRSIPPRRAGSSHSARSRSFSHSSSGSHRISTGRRSPRSLRLPGPRPPRSAGPARPGRRTSRSGTADAPGSPRRSRPDPSPAPGRSRG